MTRLRIGLGIAALSALALALRPSAGETQAGGPDKLVIAMYAPTVEFPNSAARLSYVQNLAKAVAANADIKVEARAYASLAQLRKQAPDFAIVDGQCYAANSQWPLLANGKVGGQTARPWALYSSVGPDMQGLKGKKLAFVKMGCNDVAFIENAMLESEVGSSYFSGMVAKPDLNGAIAEVVSYKGAQAVFAPIGSQKGLTKVFDTGAVPTPAFVQVNSGLDAALVAKVRNAVTGYGGGGAIDGWTGGEAEPYKSLRSRMGKKVKRPVFAEPTPVRVDSSDILIEPATLNQPAFTDLDQHFEMPPERQ